MSSVPTFKEDDWLDLLTVSVLLQVVIKYVPYVGDSKRALDEYTSEIMMGGTNTIAMHNTCEVSVSVKWVTTAFNVTINTA